MNERPKFTQSASKVFELLASGGPATRKQLAEQLDLSRPTLSTVMGELSQVDYVDRVSEVHGYTGRRAGMYRLASGAGCVIGIDAGSTRVSLRVSTLDRRELLSVDTHLSQSQPELNDVIAAEVAGLLRKVLAGDRSNWGPVRKIGIAVPARVRNSDVIDELTRPLGVVAKAAGDIPLGFENNVNCATIAEKFSGAAKGSYSFIYVQIGVKIGMGLIQNDVLIRGVNGATGELAWIPFPLAPGASPAPQEYEHYLGAESVLTRVQQSWAERGGDASIMPRTIPALYDMAKADHPLALDMVHNQAQDIARLIAVCVAVTDPGLVVLGGGIGQNHLLKPLVQTYLDKIAVPTQVVSGTMGRDATLIGITELTAQHAVTDLTGLS